MEVLVRHLRPGNSIRGQYWLCFRVQTFLNPIVFDEAVVVPHPVRWWRSSSSSCLYSPTESANSWNLIASHHVNHSLVHSVSFKRNLCMWFNGITSVNHCLGTRGAQQGGSNNTPNLSRIDTRLGSITRIYTVFAYRGSKANRGSGSLAKW